jgi:hypothetical protein
MIEPQKELVSKRFMLAHEHFVISLHSFNNGLTLSDDSKLRAAMHGTGLDVILAIRLPTVLFAWLADCSQDHI